MVSASRSSVPVLIVTGPVGVGKTSVAEEIFDQLAARDMPHAVVDLDGLGLCWPFGHDDPFNQQMAMANLAAVWQNYCAAGAARLVIARVVETRGELVDYRRAVPGAAIQVCLLAATKQTLRARVASRETGSSFESLAHRADELADVMANSDVADFTVETEDRALVDIALEVLRRAHWIDAN
jgi:GTPase SAR1 family protein